MLEGVDPTRMIHRRHGRSKTFAVQIVHQARALQRLLDSGIFDPMGAEA
jgi:hypothetical protein